MADRFAVMVDGRFLRVLDAGEADLETVGMLMGGAETETETGVRSGARTVA